MDAQCLEAENEKSEGRYIHFYVNSVWKGVSPSLLSPAMGYISGQTRRRKILVWG